MVVAIDSTWICFPGHFLSTDRKMKMSTEKHRRTVSVISSVRSNCFPDCADLVTLWREKQFWSFCLSCAGLEICQFELGWNHCCLIRILRSSTDYSVTPHNSKLIIGSSPSHWQHFHFVTDHVTWKSKAQFTQDVEHLTTGVCKFWNTLQ